MSGYSTIEGKLDAKGLKTAIVASRFNDFVTTKLIEGAVDCLVRHGAADKDISVIRVPGSFEVPLAAKKAASSGKYNAVICLGALIRGIEQHDFAILPRGANRLGRNSERNEEQEQRSAQPTRCPVKSCRHHGFASHQPVFIILACSARTSAYAVDSSSATSL